MKQMQCAVEVDSPTPYGVQEGPDCSNCSLMPHLRLACICRRRLTCVATMDRRGTVAVVEEVARGGEGGAISCRGRLSDTIWCVGRLWWSKEDATA